jgi:GTP cyclohydrolase II
MDLDQQIDRLIKQRLDKNELASQLGFFSKPVRIISGNVEYVVKLYKPVRNRKLVETIVNNHDKYVDQMRKIGIKIPETTLMKKDTGGKTILLIVQKAFLENELVRGMVETGEREKVIHLMKLLIDDSILFWKNKPTGKKIGFHPTTRNYALLNDQLQYFDTFPPMLMEQKALNRIILQMAPIKVNVKGIIPLQMVNRVSDEYYMIDKMIAGIVGSTCRLRAELREDILEFSRNYIQTNTHLSDEEKSGVLILLNKPPQLSGLWVTLRKFFGKPGKPNLKS